MCVLSGPDMDHAVNREQTRTAIVTGASSGIGRAIALELVRNSFEVFGVDIEAPSEAGWHHVSADVRDEASVAAAISEIASTVASIDVLINNAGILIEGALSNTPIEDFDRQLAVNVRGPFLMAQKALPYMPNGGKIINLASELAFLGRANSSAYCASKGAIISMTRLGPRAGPAQSRQCRGTGTDRHALARVRSVVGCAEGSRVGESSRANRATRGGRPGRVVPGRQRGLIHHRTVHQRRRRRSHALSGDE